MCWYQRQLHIDQISAVNSSSCWLLSRLLYSFEKIYLSSSFCRKLASTEVALSCKKRSSLTMKVALLNSRNVSQNDKINSSFCRKK